MDNFETSARVAPVVGASSKFGVPGRRRPARVIAIARDADRATFRPRLRSEGFAASIRSEA